MCRCDGTLTLTLWRSMGFIMVPWKNSTVVKCLLNRPSSSRSGGFLYIPKKLKHNIKCKRNIKRHISRRTRLILNHKLGILSFTMQLLCKILQNLKRRRCAIEIRIYKSNIGFINLTPSRYLDSFKVNCVHHGTLKKLHGCIVSL